jgi:hypothetical protein
MLALVATIPMFEIHLNSRNENMVTLTCRVSIASFTSHLDFFLNGTTVVNDIRKERNENTIVLEITPRYEGRFSCGFHDLDTQMTLESNRIGPYAGKN